MSHPNQVGQWGTYLWSHATPVGQQIIVPISIRLANGVPICGPMQHRLANQSLSPSQSGWPMGFLFVVPYNTGWPINHCPHLYQIGQWGTYLWSHATPVGQPIIVPIPIRLANRVPICGPMQHWLANQSLSPSQSDWPMGYLFVVPYNTGWPTNHCPHLNQVGQWGTYLWSHATPVGQSIIVPISIRLANGVPICGPMQHQLANKSLSPSQSRWPMRYLFWHPM